MPNQRKQGKRHAGSWLTDPVYAALVKRANEAGVSISDMMKRFTEEGLGFEPRKSARKADTDGKD